MAGAGVQNVAKGLGWGKLLVFPVAGEFSGQGSVFSVLQQEPGVFGLNSYHK